MLKKLLIANRGEIAIRIARTAAEMGLTTVAIYPEDDAQSLHTRKTDEMLTLKGMGAAAYLDIPQIVMLARAAECDAIHPGYGFLSENADFAKACTDAGLIFVGPDAQTLLLFGDKAHARALAERSGVPILKGTRAGIDSKHAQAFLESLGQGGAIMLKAVAGGGGRGMRVVSSVGEVASAFERCS